jgi:hypothetical protein
MSYNENTCCFCGRFLREGEETACLECAREEEMGRLATLEEMRDCINCQWNGQCDSCGFDLE